MGIARLHRKRHSFSIIDNSGAEDSSLSWKARGILWYLLTKPDNWTVRISDLINQSEKDGRDAVKSGFKELEESGYAFRVKVRNGHGRFEWYTEVFECKEDAKVWLDDFHQSGKSVDGFSVDGKHVDIVITDSTHTDQPITESKLNKSFKSCKAFQENAPHTKKEEDASLNPNHPEPVLVNNCAEVVGSPPPTPQVPPPPSSPKKARKSPIKTTLDIDDEGWVQLPDEDRYKLANFIATRRMQYHLIVLNQDNGVMPFGIYSDSDNYAVLGRQMYITQTDHGDKGWEDEVLAPNGEFGLRLLRNWSYKFDKIDQDYYNESLERFFIEAQRFLTRRNAKKLLDTTPLPKLFPQDELLNEELGFLDWAKRNQKQSA